MPFKDKTKQRAAQLAYYYRNRGACQERARQWKLEHPERVRELHLTWERSTTRSNPVKSNALGRVQKYFPQVEVVRDAKRDLDIEVTRLDSNMAKKKAHNSCAMAVACKRKENADGVLVSRRVAYVIKGTEATRYRVPEYVTREIVSFDRGAGFHPGSYTLPAPQKYERLGMVKSHGTGKKSRGLRKQSKTHQTYGIRTALGASR